MKVDKAFKEWKVMAPPKNMRGYLWSRTQVDIMDLIINEQTKSAHTAGYKQGRIDLADDINAILILVKITPNGLKLLEELIDTELNKTKS